MCRYLSFADCPETWEPGLVVEISRYSRLEDLPAGSGPLIRLWADAFADDAAADGRDIRGDLAKHATRRDFQLLTATDPDLVGFIYGYSGERGQWWPEWVAAAVSTDLTHSWLDKPHLELVELAVAPAAQGRGIGRTLVEALLAHSSSDRAVLTTASDNSAARHLYSTIGWQLLADGFSPGWCLYGYTRS